jgi:hypothetical protein
LLEFKTLLQAFAGNLSNTLDEVKATRQEMQDLAKEVTPTLLVLLIRQNQEILSRLDQKPVIPVVHVTPADQGIP